MTYISDFLGVKEIFYKSPKRKNPVVKGADFWGHRIGRSLLIHRLENLTFRPLRSVTEEGCSTASSNKILQFSSTSTLSVCGKSNTWNIPR
jgi:hypothetical protein